MPRLSWLLALLSVAPSITVTAANVKCKAVDRCAAKSKQAPSIASFCSSYLTTETITTTVSSVSTVTTGPTTITTTVSPSACAAPSSVANKVRRAAVTGAPSCLTAAGAGSAKVSSACSCFTSAATTTATSTYFATTTVAVSTSTATVTGPFAIYFTPINKYGIINTFVNVTGLTAESGTSVYLDDAGLVTYQGLNAHSDRYDDESYVEFVPLNSAYQASITCSIASAGDGTCPMTCYQQAHGYQQGTSEGYWTIGTIQGDGQAANLFAVAQ